MKPDSTESTDKTSLSYAENDAKEASKEHSAKNWLKLVLNAIVNVLIDRHEPRVEYRRNRKGNGRWYVYDPITGESAYYYNESEVRAWLEERYSRRSSASLPYKPYDSSRF